VWSNPDPEIQISGKSAEIKEKSILSKRKSWTLWSCYPDLNWGPHPYQFFPARFSFVVPCFVLAPGTVAVQRFRAFSSFVFSFPDVCSCGHVFGTRMGFVWVSCPLTAGNWHGAMHG